MKIEKVSLKQYGHNRFIKYSIQFPTLAQPITEEVSEFTQGYTDPITVIGFESSQGFELLLLTVGANSHGHGYGREALGYLRSHYSHTHIHYILDSAIGFWAKMFEKKLVDSIHFESSHLTPHQRRAWESYLSAVSEEEHNSWRT